MKIIKRILVALLLLVLALVLFVVVDDFTVALTDYNVQSDRIPLSFYGYKIICISDFHNSSNYRQIANIVNARRPDLVLFLGDMANIPDYEHDNLDLLLSAIDEDLPCYGVIGNHEYFSLGNNKVNDVAALLRTTRITLLDSYEDHYEYVDIKRGEDTIRLVGVRDVWIPSSEYTMDTMAIRLMRQTLKEMLTGEYYTILMAHRADLYPYLNDLNADLLLSGHMHGGLIRLPVVGGLFSPENGLLPNYDAGVFKETSMTMIVSRGCDLDILRPRVFNGPEVVEITLRR